ncbi:MAG: hypothetical protein ACYTGN_16195 [Planctomycetota bacterium]|jgi:VIT1/CCC1 family predicted Fe2+/Mn2+ transporter
MSDPALAKHKYAALVGVVTITGATVCLTLMILASKYDRINLWPVAAVVAALCVLGIVVAGLIAKR